MSIPLIIDEWLYSDLNGKNGPEKQKQTLDFLERVLFICDRIVFSTGTPIEEKFYTLLASSNNSVEKKRIAKYLNLYFYMNSKKSIF